MEEKKFTWIPFYEEFADILRGYRDRQEELIEFLEELKNKKLKVPSLQDKNSEGEKSLIKEIDPFTFYGAFNRSQPISGEARIAVIEAIKERFQVKADVPADFHGVPRLNVMKPKFFPPASMKEEGHSEKLWRLYGLALDKEPLSDSEFADAFNEVLRLREVGKSKLTIGLFWIRPHVFLNLNGPVRRYLRHLYPGITWKGLWRKFNFEKYKEAYDKVGQNDQRPFCEISHEAFCYAEEQKKKQNEEMQVFLDNLGLRDISKSDEEKAIDIPLNTILYGPPGTGKTYHTINEAVKILDRESYSESKGDREEIQDRFEELKEDGRVDFVTFH